MTLWLMECNWNHGNCIRRISKVYIILFKKKEVETVSAIYRCILKKYANYVVNITEFIKFILMTMVYIYIYT